MRIDRGNGFVGLKRLEGGIMDKYVVVRKLDGQELDRSPKEMEYWEAQMVLNYARDKEDGFEYKLKRVDGHCDNEK